MSVVGGAAGGEGEGAAGCNDKNKNPTIECGEKPTRHHQKNQRPRFFNTNNHSSHFTTTTKVR